MGGISYKKGIKLLNFSLVQKQRKKMFYATQN